MFKTKKFNTHILPIGLALGILALAAGLVQRAAAHPSPAGAAAPAKVGVVSLEEAIIATNDGKKEYSQLQQQFAPRQAEMKAMQDEITTMQTSLKAEAGKLSDADRNARVKKIEAKEKEFNRHMDLARNDAQQAEQQLFARLSPKMMGVMKRYAETHGYSVIVDASSPASPVLYASAEANITKQLVEAYDSSAAGSGSASTAPAATPSAASSPN